MASGKPDSAYLDELQRHFLQLRWDAISARNDHAFYPRDIDVTVALNAMGDTSARNGAPGELAAIARATGRRNLPSFAKPASPMLSSYALFMDAATCGLANRRRKISDFGDGMIEYDVDQGRVVFFPENIQGYRARRLAIGIALLYVWMFFGLLLFWIIRDATGLFPRLTVPPYGSGIIHLLLSLSVVLTYAAGTLIVPPFKTVGMREGAIPSLLPLVLETPCSQFMCSYSWGSRYVELARSLSEVLADCWLDERELTPGDHVTHQTAHAIASARCLVIFFSYEYLRSVNCTLEFLAALRHRGPPQRTILLLEALDAPALSKRVKGGPLIPSEARAVADILSQAVPGLIVARGVAGLLDTLDQRCIRSLSSTATASTTEWWTTNGLARGTRVSSLVRVVPPLIEPELKQRWSTRYTFNRRRRGDVVGGFMLISGDGTRVERYRPLDSSARTLIAVLCVEALVYLHMFIYCSPGLDALTTGSRFFQGSCLPGSTFLYLVSLLPLIMVVVQYLINNGIDASQLHDEMLTPLVVAARLGHTEPSRARRESSAPGPGGSFAAAASSRNLGAAAASSFRNLGPSSSLPASADSIAIIFVTSDSPCAAFAAFTQGMSEFVTRRALGIPTQTIKVSALPAAPRRLAVYVFLLDSAASVDAFFHRVHRSSSSSSSDTSAATSVAPEVPERGASAAGTAPPAATWQTTPVIIVVHADVLQLREGGAAAGGAPNAPAASVASAPLLPPTDAASGGAPPDQIALQMDALPATCADGSLAPHLRTVLLEYLLIVTGAKAGIDPVSPYDSLAQAVLDSVGRKVGAVLEARSGPAAVSSPRPRSLDRPLNSPGAAAASSAAPVSATDVVLNPLAIAAAALSTGASRPLGILSSEPPGQGGAGQAAQPSTFENPLHAPPAAAAPPGEPSGGGSGQSAPLAAARLAGDESARQIGFAAQAASSRSRTLRKTAAYSSGGGSSSGRKPDAAAAKSARPEAAIASATAVLLNPRSSDADVVAACDSLKVADLPRRELRAAGATLLPALASRLASAAGGGAGGGVGSPGVAAAIYRVMAPLSDHADTRTRAVMAASGVPALLAQALKDAAAPKTPLPSGKGPAPASPTAVSPVSLILWLLGNVCRDTAAAADLVAAGGLPPLLSMLRPGVATTEDGDDLAFHACMALVPLAERSASAAALLNAGALKALAGCLPLSPASAAAAGASQIRPPSGALVEATCSVLHHLVTTRSSARPAAVTCEEVVACGLMRGVRAALDLSCAEEASLNASLAAHAASALLAAVQCAGVTRAASGTASPAADAVFASAKELAPRLEELRRRSAAAAAAGGGGGGGSAAPEGGEASSSGEPPERILSTSLRELAALLPVG